MNDYLVTIKLARNPDHNPRQKVTAKCPFHGSVCTDATGEHHTVMAKGYSASEVYARFAKDYHVTRVEGAVYL